MRGGGGCECMALPLLDLEMNGLLMIISYHCLACVHPPLTHAKLACAMPPPPPPLVRLVSR
jgi:hypothetical protein